MRPLRLFAAGLATETNTFAPFPTGYLGFEEGGVFRGDGSLKGGSLQPVLRVWRQACEAGGIAFAEGFSSSAQPAGTTVRAVYESYRDEILADIQARGPFDIVLLALHGAMVAEGYDDCEGDLIESIRTLSPEGTIIGGELDPHFHLTERMLRHADVLIAAKEYPHIDFAERAQELFDICLGARRGALKPVMADFDCRMVGWYPTTSEPMKSLVAKARAMETEPGVLSVSIAHGFPWADVAAVGTRTLVVTDGDPALAEAKAAELGMAIYEQRQALLPKFPQLEEALDRAAALEGRVVIADIADNAGGGAPSDNTGMLRAMLARGVSHAACGLFWDPIAARICAEAGVGAVIPLRLGGKVGPMSAEPLDVVATVRAVAEEHDQIRFNGRGPLGRSVWIEVAGIDVVIITLRSQTFAPDAFTGLGIDLQSKRLIAVKSSQHFQAEFAPIADHIIQAATLGAMQMDFGALPYTKREPNYFPRVDDPMAAG
jgi:microcystin degradation protein MlrC